MTNRTPARDRPGPLGWRRGSQYRGGRVTPVEGTRYDDGGVSGGTLDRPALQQLLADIKARKVDTCCFQNASPGCKTFRPRSCSSRTAATTTRSTACPSSSAGFRGPRGSGRAFGGSDPADVGLKRWRHFRILARAFLAENRSFPLDFSCEESVTGFVR